MIRARYKNVRNSLRNRFNPLADELFRLIRVNKKVKKTVLSKLAK